MSNEIANLLDVLARSWLTRIALAVFALCLAAVFLIGITQNIYGWSAAAPPPFIATVDVWKLGMVIGTVGTAATLLITLYVADRNYRRSREHIPSLSMTLEIHRIAASAQYDAVIAILNAHNTGTGLCQSDKVQWSTRVLSPYDDDTITNLSKKFADAVADADAEFEFPWREENCFETKQKLQIEPRGQKQLTHDFIIPVTITAIVVSVWVDNALETDTGWPCRAVHIRRED